MPVKYHCPKCHRRFTEWGAEKVGFKCPHDQWCSKDATGEIELVRGGALDDKVLKKPSLKRVVKKVVVAEEIDLGAADEVLVPDLEDAEDEEEAVAPEELIAVEEEEEAVVKFEGDDALPIADDEDEDAEEADLDVAEDLAFGVTPPQLGEELIDGIESDVRDWSE